MTRDVHPFSALLLLFLNLFLAALGLRCFVRAFSSCGEWGLLFVVMCGALGARASVIVARGLSSCGLQALERRLSSCGAQALLLRGMWDLPRPELGPVSPALAGGFLTTAPPGKPFLHYCILLQSVCIPLET